MDELNLTRDEACFVARVLNTTSKKDQAVVVKNEESFALKVVPKNSLCGTNEVRTCENKKFEIFDNVIDDYFISHLTQGEIAKKWDRSKNTIQQWISEYRKTGITCKELKEQYVKSTNWEEYKPLVEIMLREIAKGSVKKEIMRKYGLTDKVYTDVRCKITREVYRHVDEYLDMVERFGG